MCFTNASTDKSPRCDRGGGARAQPGVLIFDSGVGAISIAREIHRQIPGLRLHFGIDNAFFPYGDKSPRQLRARIVKVAKTMLARCGADMLVVACNTASTLALPALRAALSVPVVGVVPAIKPAAAASRTGTIALLATEGTVNRKYTRELIANFGNGTAVINVPAPELVWLAEAHLRGETVTAAALAPVLERIFSAPGGDRVDVAVLACTHFPLLRTELERAAPKPVQWLDSGAAIARRVEWWLGELGLVVSNHSLPDNEAGLLLASAANKNAKLAQAFREFNLTTMVGVQ